MNNDETYAVSVAIHHETPIEYRELAKRRAREQVAIKLLETIYQPDRPIYTVRFVEEDHPRYFPDDVAVHDYTEYRFGVELSRVNVRHISVFEPFDYSALPLRALTATAFDEVKARTRRNITRRVMHARESLSKFFHWLVDGGK